MKNNETKSDIQSESQNQSNIEIFQSNSIDNLKVIKTIGRGINSEVYEVSHEQHLALKVLCITSNNKEQFKKLQLFLQVYQILHFLNHKNIIRSFGFCFGDEKHAPSILFEFCPQNLNDVVDDLNDIEKVCAIIEICLGMEAAHSSNLIHRNLKPENILFNNEGHVKVSDFGLIHISDEGNNNKINFKFVAPEILNKNDECSNKVDVFSFGSLVFFILTGGKMPKISLNDQKSGKKAQIPKYINKISRDLINRCWEMKPDERFSFSDIIGFIKNKNFKLIDGVEEKVNEIKKFISF